MFFVIGPCPPCPKQVTSTCHCGQSSPKTLRCFAKSWSCGKPCSNILPCTLHKCPETCHTESCPPCQVPTTLTCKCSSPSPIVIPCSQLLAVDENGAPLCSISCGRTCKKILDCGIHKCSRDCHEDDCGTCERTCPCGKARALCSGESGEGIGKPCGDTCEKVLDCGQHLCAQKCHSGGCGSCLQYVIKKCKCEQYEKEQLCSKEFVCATKCKKLRDCKIHPCNKKCCPGDCAPCRNICGKTLSCKNHKCESICHSGPCYPCPVTAQVKCRCGQTIRQVPCGSERKCKPPDCHQPCSRPPKCDHSKIQNHRCHFGDCPKCRIPCGKTLNCRHQCPAVCHTVKAKSELSKPCPKCVQLVLTKCRLHMGVQVPCHALDQRCTEICGKALGCNEHYCKKPCHEDVSAECGECTEPCSKRRPANCQHVCDLGCHQGPCQPCTLVAKVMCHCETEEMFITCSKQVKLSDAERSCKNQCPKKLSCGHRCLSLCHPGDCPELERCRRKVKLTCKCKHFKKELECFLIGDTKVLDCAPGTCNIPKTPKDTPGGGGAKKRARKKKTSEGESHKEDNLDELGKSNNLDKQNSSEKEKKGSIFSSNLKAIGIIAISAFVTASALQFYSDYFSTSVGTSVNT
jgi:NF-X1-type zinc finger protein NFXL1